MEELEIQTAGESPERKLDVPAPAGPDAGGPVPADGAVAPGSAAVAAVAAGPETVAGDRPAPESSTAGVEAADPEPAAASQTASDAGAGDSMAAEGGPAPASGSTGVEAAEPEAAAASQTASDAGAGDSIAAEGGPAPASGSTGVEAAEPEAVAASQTASDAGAGDSMTAEGGPAPASGSTGVEAAEPEAAATAQAASDAEAANSMMAEGGPAPASSEAGVEAADPEAASEPEAAAEPPADSADKSGATGPSESVFADDLLALTEQPSTDACVEDAHLKAVLEAIVYVTEEPLTVAQMAAALQQPADRIQSLLNELIDVFEKPEHGLTIKEVAGGYKMATKAEHHDAVRNFVKSLKPPLKLSLPALETLAVIAYKQPVTGPEIMEIRGVQGAGVLKTLLDRKLIAVAGRKNVIGKPMLYKTTKEFLLQFGLKDLAELPSLKEFEEIRRMAFSEETQPAAEAVPEVQAVAESPAAETAPVEESAAKPAADGAAEPVSAETSSTGPLPESPEPKQEV